MGWPMKWGLFGPWTKLAELQKDDGRADDVQKADGYGAKRALLIRSQKRDFSNFLHLHFIFISPTRLSMCRM